MSTEPTALTLSLPSGATVSGLLLQPARPRACFVLAHGAGAGMRHAFMQDLARALAASGVATLRFNFPFMEQGSKRTDAPAVAQATVRRAVAEAALRLPGVPLFAGGKSFGARMASQAQALDALPGVRGLVSVGFPLHPAGKPSTGRAAHLAQVRVPQLFLQGTRDALADLDLVRGTVAPLGALATLHVVEGADHGFHVLVRSGRKDAEVIEELAQVASAWMERQAAG
jgi:predicted alpha/beta-hydrolase family hydrolase